MQTCSALGLNRSQLAKLLGARHSVVGRWARGEAKPSGTTMLLLRAIRTRTLRKSPDWLKEAGREAMWAYAERGEEAGLYALLEELFQR